MKKNKMILISSILFLSSAFFMFTVVRELDLMLIIYLLLITILTEWGENLDKDNILKEYPRPQYRRDSYLNLNGKWKYALRAKNQKIGEYDGDILVPFSIESPLSGVQKSLKPGMILYYNRKININDLANKGRYILKKALKELIFCKDTSSKIDFEIEPKDTLAMI